MLSAYETGRQRPSLETLEKILDTLGCDLNDLHNAIQIINGRPERMKRRGEGVNEEGEGAPAAAVEGGGGRGGLQRILGRRGAVAGGGGRRTGRSAAHPRPARAVGGRGGAGARRDAGRLPPSHPLLPRHLLPEPAPAFRTGARFPARRRQGLVGARTSAPLPLPLAPS